MFNSVNSVNCVLNSNSVNCVNVTNVLMFHPHFEVLFGPIGEINAAAVYLNSSQTVFTAMHHTTKPIYLNILNIFGNNISLYTNLKIYLFFINLFICLFELLSNSLIYKIMKPKKWKIKFLKKFVCFKGFLPQISALLKVKLCISHILNTFPSEKAEQIALLCLLHKYQKYKSVESVGRST